MAINDYGIATPDKRKPNATDPFASAGGMYTPQHTTNSVTEGEGISDPPFDPSSAPPAPAPPPNAPAPPAAPPSAPAAFPSGPITDPNDPRLTDGRYATDPNVLRYINDVQGYGAAGNYQGQGPANGQFDDTAILEQIKRWSSMPGADPSLAGNPNYWLNAIKTKGGLNQSNLQYWQNAGVGDSAFFRNPNREQGGGGNQFADPSYQRLMDLVNQRLGSLSQPISHPQLDQLMAMLQQQQSAARDRAQQFATDLTGRVAQLQTPLLSQADVANRNAMASNALIASRDATLKNQREQRFASGFAPTSGLVAGDERATNEAYNNRQATIDATLRQSAIAQDEARKNQATQLQGLAQQALQGGDVTALNEQAQMSDLENQMFNQDQNRQREMLTTGNIPVDLTNMGFSNAMNAANSGGNPLSSILSMLNSANTQQGLQQNGQNSNMSALAWLLQQALH